MMLELLTDFGCAMFFSKIISINGIIVQILLLILSFFGIKDKYKKLRIFTNSFLLILLVLNGILIFNGSFTERSIVDFKGKVYIGQIENGEANGWGRLYDEDRNIKYIGFFHNNKYEGDGFLYNYYKEDEEGKGSVLKYEGEFENGKFHGVGKYYEVINGELLLVYDGEFRYGQYCGKGTNFFYDKDNKKIGTYTGGMAYNKRSGFGVYEHYDSDTKVTKKYEGTYAEDQLNGWGVFYSNNKVVYEGYWSDGYQEGNGTLYYTDDSGEERTYIGEFSKGEWHGYGQIYDKNNEIIQKGQFENGELVNEKN